MEQSPTDALRSTLGALDVTATLANPETLRERVCAVVEELKKTGMAPEHVILAIKGIVYEANMRVADTRLIDEMVKWCIKQYFASEK